MRKKFQKLFFTGLIVCMVMTGITGCKSPSDKEENTKEEQQDSEQQYVGESTYEEEDFE